jgi:hypothetical protein
MNRATTVRGLDGRFNVVTCYLEREEERVHADAKSSQITQSGSCSASLVAKLKTAWPNSSTSAPHYVRPPILLSRCEVF